MSRVDFAAFPFIVKGTLHLHLVPLSELMPSISSWKTEWDLDDWSLAAVRAVDLFWFATSIRLWTWKERSRGN